MSYSTSTGRRALATVGAAAFLVGLAGGDARAQSSPQSAIAETMFQEGKALLAQGRTAEACAKLAESMRLDPGGGTLLALAVCHEKEGKTATAWSEFGEVSARSHVDGRADRADAARARAAALEPKLSHLTVTVDPTVGAIKGLVVTIDGSPLSAGAWGQAFPADPGAHQLVAEAPGYLRWTGTVTLGAKLDQQTVRVGDLVRDPSAKVEPEAALPVPPAPEVPATPAPPPQPIASTGSGRRTASYITAAASLVPLGIGAYFGVHAASEMSDARKLCPSGTTCHNGTATSQSTSANSDANVANITIGVGIAGVALAAVLFLTSPPGESAAGKIAALPIQIGALPGGAFVGTHAAW
jgi:hypothetical protein